jgi:vacuolar-type H+-ATPase subunit E/Vma4
LEILPKYDTLFFIDSKEIAECVSQKRLFRLIDIKILDEEIQNFQTEIKQQLINTISKLKQKSKKIEDEGRNEYESFKKKIEQDEQTHLENGKKIENADKNLMALNSLYSNFLRKFNENISALESGKQLEEINDSIKKIEKEFYEEKRKLNLSTPVSSLGNTRNVSTFPLQRPSLSEYSYTEEKKSKNKGFVIFSLVLNVLLIGALVFFTLFYEKEKNPEVIPNVTPVQEDTTLNEVSDQDNLWKSNLNPAPNDSAKDVANKQIMLDLLSDDNSNIGNVVDIIFAKNKIIKDVYGFQKKDYGKILFKENPGAFTKRNQDTVLVKKDSLKKIPVFVPR